jgi:hypothetical protein
MLSDQHVRLGELAPNGAITDFSYNRVSGKSKAYVVGPKAKRGSSNSFGSIKNSFPEQNNFCSETDLNHVSERIQALVIF